MSRRQVGDRVVMSPMEALVAGGAAEAFERQLQQLYRGGYRHLIVDLSGVSAMDSAGIRARIASWPWRTIRIAVAGAVLCTVLVWAGLAWPVELTGLTEKAVQMLMADGAGVKSVAWEHPKRERP